MKPIKLSHLLFSLAVIAALVTAAIPAAPAYALTAQASDHTSISAAGDESPANAIACRKVTKWRDGHRVTIRLYHRLRPPRPDGGA